MGQTERVALGVLADSALTPPLRLVPTFQTILAAGWVIFRFTGCDDGLFSTLAC